jgi:hypothetical protein
MTDDQHRIRRSLTQLNVRLPHAESTALRQLARDGGVSLNALLGAILSSFLTDHTQRIPSPVLVRARTIDSTRRERPHLRQSHESAAEQ